jgi:hypothetical protein
MVRPQARLYLNCNHREHKDVEPESAVAERLRGIASGGGSHQKCRADHGKVSYHPSGRLAMTFERPVERRLGQRPKVASRKG